MTHYDYATPEQIARYLTERTGATVSELMLALHDLQELAEDNNKLMLLYDTLAKLARNDPEQLAPASASVAMFRAIRQDNHSKPLYDNAEYLQALGRDEAYILDELQESIEDDYLIHRQYASPELCKACFMELAEIADGRAIARQILIDTEAKMKAQALERDIYLYRECLEALKYFHRSNGSTASLFENDYSEHIKITASLRAKLPEETALEIEEGCELAEIIELQHNNIPIDTEA